MEIKTSTSVNCADLTNPTYLSKIMEVIRKELETGTMLIVEVPDDASGYKLKEDCLYFDIKYGLGNELVSLPSKGFKLIGDSKQLTEDDLVGVIPTTLMHKKHGINCYKYRSFSDGFMGFETALEAFNSLKESLQIVDVNKYGHKPDETFNHPSWEFIRNKWQSEKAKVKKYIVLFKPKYLL